MEGRALVFINFIQAAQFGHVGWGFLVDAARDQYYFGSTDHLWRHPWWDLAAWVRYAHVEPSCNNDWWSQIGSYEEMMQIMHSGHHIRYHAAKVVPVIEAEPSTAMKRAESLMHGGWSVLVNNCVHQTYSVLTDYGASIPRPEEPLTNVIPKRWFANIAGEYIELSR